jgi:hypothetical protein
MARFIYLVVFVGIAAFPAHGQAKQYMRVTSLQYREKNTEAPYRVEGKSSPTVLYYRLSCKKGASNLHVGRAYQIEESTDEDNIKTLLILYPDSDKPDVEKPRPDATIIGVTCTVESVTTREGR